MSHLPLDGADLIERLGLEPHPEGGWFAETWRDEPEGGGRGSGTAIYFLLRADERSHWHRVNATEIWHTVRRSLEWLPLRGCCRVRWR